MGVVRVQKRFKEIAERGRLGLIPFLTIGFPDPEATMGLVPALVEGGADLIELGVPFSDPLADGPTIQRSSFQALKQGVTLKRCLEVCASLRWRGIEVPLLLMGYYNPILSYGLERVAKEAAQAGVDGFIVADLPPEETGPFREVCQGERMCIIPLLAPTSSPERIAMGCHKAEGFIYCVSLTGVTGARAELPPGVPELVRQVRGHTSLPVAVGFGISRREHVESLQGVADAAVIGSALIDIIDRAPREQVASRAREFISRLWDSEKLSKRGG